MHSSPVHLFGPERTETAGHSQMIFVREKHTLLWPAVPSVAAEIRSGGNHDLLGQRSVGHGPFSRGGSPPRASLRCSRGLPFAGN
jgi:hypothetical protein